MLAEQPAQLPGADTEPVTQALDVVVVEPTGLDQRERARNGVGGAAPERKLGRNFRPATQAWAEAGFLRRRGRRIERDIFELRRARRADRPAVDSGGLDADEQSSVEAGVARRDCAVASGAVHIHHATILHGGAPVLPCAERTISSRK